MTSELRIVTRTRAPRDRLFDESLSIDAHIDSMSQSRERAISGVTSGRIGLSETVTWRARHFGVWITMTSKITELEPGRRFVDEQVRGPFRSFRHEHLFESVDADGENAETVMTDVLTIGSPVFGRLAERWFLVPYLRRLIQQRNRHLIARADV